MRVEVFNRNTRLSGLSEKEVEELDKLTSFSVPGAYFSPSYHRYETVTEIVNGKKRKVQKRVGWDGRKRFLKKRKGLLSGTFTLPTGLFLTLKKPFFSDAKIYDHRVHPSKWYSSGNYSSSKLRSLIKKRFEGIRDSQLDAAVKMIRAARTGGLILHATGTGKTYLAGVVFSMLFDVRCVFVVDELTLLKQARQELASVTKEKIGIIGASHYNPHRLSVATVQTLSLHKNDLEFRKWLDTVGIFVFDELHVQMANRNFGIVYELKPPTIFGLTATLQMKKKSVRLRAHALCGRFLDGYSVEEGIKDKVLSKAAVVRVLFENYRRKSKGTHAYHADYHKIVTHSRSRNDVVEGIVRQALWWNRSVIVLVEYVKHLKIIGRRLENKNPSLVWGGRPVDERRKSQKDFDKGKLDLIVANKVFAKGINIKSVDTGVSAGAMKSPNIAMQSFGRFLRQFEGKKYALYFDISDKGNRFERAAKRRYSTFKAAGIPVIQVKPPENGLYRRWFLKVINRVERKLGV